MEETNQKMVEYMAGAFQLSEIVDYQQNAVVSSTLMNKAGGTVTAFAFDAG